MMAEVAVVMAVALEAAAVVKKAVNVCVDVKGGSGGDVRGREVCICGEEVGDCGGMEDDQDVTGGVDVED